MLSICFCFQISLTNWSCFAGSKIPEQRDWWAVQAFLNSCGDLLAGRAAEDRSHNAKSLRLMAKFMSDTGNKCLTRLKYYAWWAHWGWNRIGCNAGRSNTEIGMTCETLHDKSECRCLLWFILVVLHRSAFLVWCPPVAQPTFLFGFAWVS